MSADIVAVAVVVFLVAAVSIKAAAPLTWLRAKRVRLRASRRGGVLDFTGKKP